MSGSTVIPSSWKKTSAWVYAPKESITKNRSKIQGFWTQRYGERSPQEVWLFQNSEAPRQIDEKHTHGIWGYKQGARPSDRRPEDVLFFPPKIKPPSYISPQGIWMLPLVHLQDEIDKLNPGDAGFLKVGSHVSKEENLDVSGQWNMIYKRDNLSLKMKIHVKTPNGKTLTLNVQRDDTIDSVKDQISEMEGIPKNQQRLVFGSQLLDDGPTLEDYNIDDGDTLELKPMQISVVDQTGRKFSLAVTSTDTIEIVKQKILKKVGIPKDQQRLTFHGQTLEDRRTLQQYRVEHGDTLNLGSMQINVKDSNGNMYRIDVNTNDTVDSVKDKIKKKTGIPKDNQRLDFKGRPLKDGKTLQDYDIKHGDTLDLDSGMQIRVKAPNGDTFNLNVNADDTIDDVKDKICQKKGIPKDAQRLLFQGDLLQDRRTLEDYNIKNGSTVDVEFMQIIIETEKGRKFTLSVAPGDDIDSVKKKIKDEVGIPRDLQNLFFHGRPLENGSASLQSHKILHKSVVTVEMMQVEIQDWTGRTFMLYVKPKDTIDSIKSQIASMENIPKGEQKLFFKGEELEDSKTVKDYGIKHKSTLNLDKADGPTYQVEMTNWQNPMMQGYDPGPKVQYEGKRDKSNIYAYLYEGPNAKKKPTYMNKK